MGSVAALVACRGRNLAEFAGADDRRDPVSLLQSQAASRIAELVPIRYGRMLASPWTFFRGAALVMAADLAPVPHTGISVQLCGDAHLCNFGLFGSPERSLVFDINDFDETLPGPWEWDVKRLTASLAVAARNNGSPERTATGGARVRRAYRETMHALAAMRELDVWYAQNRVDDALLSSVTPRPPRASGRRRRHARSRDSTQALSKLTRVIDGRRQFVSDPPLLIPIEELVGEAEAVGYGRNDGRPHRRLSGDARTSACSHWLADSATPEWPARSSAWEASVCGRGWC